MEINHILSKKDRREAKGQLDRYYDDVATVLLAWHNVEGNAGGIIDYNVVGPFSEESLRTQRYVSATPRRALIAEDISGLNQDLSLLIPPEEEKHNWRFLVDQLASSKVYLDKLLKREMTPAEYIEGTLQVPFEPMDERILDSLQDDVESQARDLGIEPPTEKGMLQWKMENKLTPEEVEHLFVEVGNAITKKLGKFIGEKISLKYKVEVVSSDSYWWTWADTDDQTGEFRFQLNFSEQRQKFWTPGKLEELGAHEVTAHQGRMSKRQELIKKGKLHPVFGITNVFSSQAVVEEGLGLTITHFIPGVYDDLSAEGRFQVDSVIYRHLVYGNAHYMLHAQGESHKKISDYIKSRIPWEPQEEINRQIQERTEDTLLMTYAYSYSAGAWRFLLYAHNLSDSGKREFLRKMLSKPYTANQADKLFHSLIREPKFQGGSFKNARPISVNSFPSGNSFVS